MLQLVFSHKVIKAFTCGFNIKNPFWKMKFVVLVWSIIAKLSESVQACMGTHGCIDFTECQIKYLLLFVSVLACARVRVRWIIWFSNYFLVFDFGWFLNVLKFKDVCLFQCGKEMYLCVYYYIHTRFYMCVRIAKNKEHYKWKIKID